MPGKRMIDESICIDKRLNSVSEGAENLFYRLLVKTDDAGRVFADASLIKGQIYPRRDVSVRQIEKRLKELSEAKDEKGQGLIVLYEVNKERYCHFPKFTKHQRLRTDIKQKISYPQPLSVTPSERAVTDLNETEEQVSKKVISKKVSKQEIGDFKKIYGKDKEKLKNHLTARGFKPARIRNILKRVMGEIPSASSKSAVKQAKQLLKELSTEELLELYHSSKDLQTFKNRLIKLGYTQEKIGEIDKKLKREGI